MNDGITAELGGEDPTLALQKCSKVGTFPSSYAVILSFIYCFTTFYCIDPYFIYKLKILVCLVFCSFSTASYSVTYELAITVSSCIKVRTVPKLEAHRPVVACIAYL